MRSKNLLSRLRWIATALPLALLGLSACAEDDNPLSPYQGGRAMSKLVADSTSHVPKMTWLGGYVAALGVNRGERAALDSTLVWLISAADDEIRFPATFGQVPAGAQDLTEQYGGQRLERLVEDNIYTYWVIKAEAWRQIASLQNRTLILDQSPGAANVAARNDTVFLSPMVHTQENQPLDVFVNIRDVRPLGRLGLISVHQPTLNPNVMISWSIAQPGVTDSSISVLGLINAQQYQETGKVWEVWSVDSTGGQTVFGGKNVISSPLALGQQLGETRVFIEFPAEGLQRGTDYYFWMANKDWDRQGRLRSTNFYAYVTFRTW